MDVPHLRRNPANCRLRSSGALTVAAQAYHQSEIVGSNVIPLGRIQVHYYSRDRRLRRVQAYTNSAHATLIDYQPAQARPRNTVWNINHQPLGIGNHLNLRRSRPADLDLYLTWSLAQNRNFFYRADTPALCHYRNGQHTHQRNCEQFL